MKAENLGRLSLLVSVLPLTLFIYPALENRHGCAVGLYHLCGVRASDYCRLCICDLVGKKQKDADGHIESGINP